jgi:hypothetical protein
MRMTRDAMIERGGTMYGEVSDISANFGLNEC